MTALTDVLLEQQHAWAHAWNAGHGYRTGPQLDAALHDLEAMGRDLRKLEGELTAYAAVMNRPVLIEAATARGAVQLQMRDLLDGCDDATLLAYRAEAMRAIADGAALAEHIDRLRASRRTT